MIYARVARTIAVVIMMRCWMPRTVVGETSPTPMATWFAKRTARCHPELTPRLAGTFAFVTEFYVLAVRIETEAGPIHHSNPFLDVTAQLKILMASFVVSPIATTIMTRTAIEITTGMGSTKETEITMATAGTRPADPIRNRAVKSMRKGILYALFARL